MPGLLKTEWDIIITILQKQIKKIFTLINLDYSRVEVAADEEKQKIVNGKW